MMAHYKYFMEHTVQEYKLFKHREEITKEESMSEHHNFFKLPTLDDS